MEKGQSSFRSTGIFPLNVNKFTAADFAPAEHYRNLDVESLEESGIQTNSEGAEDSATIAVEDPVMTSSSKPDSTSKDSEPSTSAAFNPERDANTSLISVEYISPIKKKVFVKY